MTPLLYEWTAPLALILYLLLFALTLKAWAASLRRVLLVVALVSHGATVVPAWFAGHDVQFGFAVSVSWTLWLMVLLVWLESWFQRLPKATAALYPFAALAVVLPIAFPGTVLIPELSTLFRAHILLAMLAYGAFTVSAAQAVLMSWLERSLHRGGRSSHWLEDLPSLLDFDAALQRSMAAGLLLVSLTLATGVWVNLSFGYGPLRLDHKTIFTILTWFMVLGFFLGRWRWGWRGRVAARFALIGFGLLLLAYVGSRFVVEVLLNPAVS
jgi:ABC-type uncharacterized transport system permease subunit